MADWGALKDASKSMDTKATSLVRDIDDLVNLVGQKEKDTTDPIKTKWGEVSIILTQQLKQFAKEATAASTALYTIAQGEKEAELEKAKTQFNAASEAGNKEKGKEKKTVTETATEKLEDVSDADDVVDKLDNLQELWMQFRVQVAKAKTALGITDTAPGAQPAGKTLTDKAKEAIAAARTALEDAEKESTKITEAKDDAKPADLQQAAKDAAAKAKAAKGSLATALDEATNAEKAATGQEKTDWGTAKNELTALTKPGGPADKAASTTQTEAEAVGKATKVADAKTAWKDSAGLLKTAKGGLDSEVLKKLAPPGTTTSILSEQKTAADRAKEAIAAAKKALEEAEKESTKITDATTSAQLEDVKTAATNAAGKARTAKESLATALTQAGTAKSEARGDEVTAWTTAISELTTAKDAAETAAAKAETEAAVVKSANSVETAKTAWKESAGLLTSAKGKLDTATLNKLAPSGSSLEKQGDQKSGDQTVTDATGKDQKKPKTAGAFGVSITAEYSKKFSLETKMHSEIKVTMVPYPAPSLFIDWIKDHFQQVKKEREREEAEI